MAVPQVAIIGRPNVGKSSIFNWLAGKRLAIVEDTPGVTRDRMGYLMCEEEKWFELVDTGGIGIDDADNLTEEIEHQILLAIEQATVLVFVVDTREGIVPLDQLVAQRLHDAELPVILIANKTDAAKFDTQISEFFALGHGEPIAVSALQHRGRNEMIEAILPHLPEEGQQDGAPDDVVMKLAIVGRRNVGKSTFINILLKTDRMIVSKVPGTTRDSVDVHFELDGKKFMAIDTPGLKRTKSISSNIEYYSYHRAQRAIRRADVVLIFFDAADEIGKVDYQLVDYTEGQHKPCIFVANKWDLLADKIRTGEWAEYIHGIFRNLPYVPVAFITGKTGRNIKVLLNHAQMLYKQATQRIGTGDLNRLVNAALEKNPPPLYRHRRPKVFYATQVGVTPPTIVLFCNWPQAFSKPYRRYLLNFLREELSFS